MLSYENNHAVFSLSEHLLFKELAKAKNSSWLKIFFILQIYIFTLMRHAFRSSKFGAQSMYAYYKACAHSKRVT